MEILEVNRNTLANLYEQFPENFKDLSMSGKYLVYNGEEVDISNFNINDLLSGESEFASSLNNLNSEDIFKIIRLHSTFLSSTNKDLTSKETKTEDKLDVIKRDNPLMRNINVVVKTDGVVKTEYFNIVDSNGEDHLFVNDRDVDIFSIYESLKVRNNGLVTPNELIEAINRKLYRISLDNARSLQDSSEVSEDFANKMNKVGEPYRDDKSVRVYGNESEDIAIVADDRAAEEHTVVTFNKNENGDLVTERHRQNVNSEETVDSASDASEDEINVTEDSDAEVKKDNEEEVVERLISEEEFYRLLNSEVDLSEEERNSVNLFYGYLGDLVLYEAYLLPELMNILNRFRAYVYGLQYEREDETELNNKQQEAIDKANEFEQNKNQVELDKDPTKVKEEVQKLTLKYDNMSAENKGVISVLLVLSIIIIVSIIVMIITFKAL